MDKVEQELMNAVGRFNTPRGALRWLMEQGLIDRRAMRIRLIRATYSALVDGGARKMEALTECAEKYHLSEDTVKDYIYRS